jgi:hypothetical protein
VPGELARRRLPARRTSDFRQHFDARSEPSHRTPRRRSICPGQRSASTFHTGEADDREMWARAQHIGRPCPHGSPGFHPSSPSNASRQGGNPMESWAPDPRSSLREIVIVVAPPRSVRIFRHRQMERTVRNQSFWALRVEETDTFQNVSVRRSSRAGCSGAFINAFERIATFFPDRLA